MIHSRNKLNKIFYTATMITSDDWIKSSSPLANSKCNGVFRRVELLCSETIYILHDHMSIILDYRILDYKSLHDNYIQASAAKSLSLKDYHQSHQSVNH